MNMNDNYFGLLDKRDSCSDAFGSDASNSNCAPSITLCCTRRGQEYPSCEKHIGYGWCCIETDGNCYVDTASDCEAINSVPCTDLKNGTDAACCLPQTSCLPGFEASEAVVRCNIAYTALTKLSFEPSTSSELDAPPSSTSEMESFPETQGNQPDATTTLLVTSIPTNEPSSNSSLSSGAVAGVAVGSCAVVILAAGVAFWAYTRWRNQAKNNPNNGGVPSNPNMAMNPHYPYPHPHQPSMDAMKDSTFYGPQGGSLSLTPGSASILSGSAATTSNTPGSIPPLAPVGYQQYLHQPNVFPRAELPDHSPAEVP